MLDVYLVRHGATEWSENGRHTGRTDLPLRPEGENEARELGPRLQKLGINSAYVSDLQRARRTAELAGFPDATVTPLLREYDYGDYEGMTSEQIWRTRPGWQLFRDGCPGGETPGQVTARSRAFLRLLDGKEGAVAVFSHGHLLRALGTTWAELDIAAADRFAMDTGGLSQLRDGARGRVIQAWNETD
jgi:probable phosphoglycerate mutase